MHLLKCMGGIFLNDCLESSSDLNSGLKIILKFIYHSVTFCAYIEWTFFKIGITKQDQTLLQFLWGKDQRTNLSLGRGDIRILQFTHASFRVKCSPFILSATIRYNLSIFKNKSKDVCELLDDIYIDDFISGCETIGMVALITNDAIEFLRLASMNVWQWVTNSLTLQQTWAEQNIDCKRTIKKLESHSKY